MRSWSIALILLVIFTAAGCGGSEPATPRQTFETYVRAMKQKDYSAMKILLSASTMKMHEQEAKAQGVTVDEIMKRESLLAQDQKTVEYKDEKIDGNKATLQFKNSYGVWETMPFLKEDGAWKIDKQGYANQIMNDVTDEGDRKLDELINGNRQQPAP